jgi:hypothetical protein
MMYKISQSSVMQKMSNTDKPEIRQSLSRISKIQLIGATTVMLLNLSKRGQNRPLEIGPKTCPSSR